MEAVGFASSLLTLVEVSGKIVLACYKYHQDIKSAKEDITRIRSEATSIRSVAERLLEMTSRMTGATLPTLRALCDSDGLLDSFLKDLKDLSLSIEPPSEKMKKLVFILKWPLTKSETEKSLVAMGRIKATLQLALAADTAFVNVFVLNK
ncbi:hypothetical protein CPLU01_10863 [Colletotrichum plurivorum]|uniref:Fungal N-terminal domain-containing protein n=1 Tax=Colletotrichum plurivorum TaxID=2175906 RepID=A0A8H6N8N4_9PEZI|nr:hypothetical protein CPLU01_10863 [Colletotrichum plurivorum]